MTHTLTTTGQQHIGLLATVTTAAVLTLVAISYAVLANLVAICICASRATTHTLSVILVEIAKEGVASDTGGSTAAGCTLITAF